MAAIMSRFMKFQERLDRIDSTLSKLGRFTFED